MHPTSPFRRRGRPRKTARRQRKLARMVRCRQPTRKRSMTLERARTTPRSAASYRAEPRQSCGISYWPGLEGLPLKDDLDAWALRAWPKANSLTPSDGDALRTAFQARLARLPRTPDADLSPAAANQPTADQEMRSRVDKSDPAIISRSNLIYNY
jgi:hypothetical protein